MASCDIAVSLNYFRIPRDYATEKAGRQLLVSRHGKCYRRTGRRAINDVMRPGYIRLTPAGSATWSGRPPRTLGSSRHAPTRPRIAPTSRRPGGLTGTDTPVAGTPGVRRTGRRAINDVTVVSGSARRAGVLTGGTAPQPHVAPGVVLGGVPGDNAHAGDVRATAATSARHPSVRNSLDPAPETTPRHAPPRTRAVAWHGGRRDVHRQSGTTTWGTRVGRPGDGRRGRRSPGPCLGSDRWCRMRRVPR